MKMIKRKKEERVKAKKYNIHSKLRYPCLCCKEPIFNKRSNAHYCDKCAKDVHYIHIMIGSHIKLMRERNPDYTIKVRIKVTKHTLEKANELNG